MQSIQLMEDRDKKRRRSGGGTTPDNALPRSSVDDHTSKRKRPRSASSKSGIHRDNQAGLWLIVFSASVDVLSMTLGGYDFEQLKSSPALLKSLFPISPMYLGPKV